METTQEIKKRIDSIRRQIVETQTKGEDTRKLEKALKEARLEETTQNEVMELKKLADQRLEFRKMASDIQDRVKRQGEAIDRFLALRDSITGPLKDLLVKAEALQQAEDDCSDPRIPNASALMTYVDHVPPEYLPRDITYPTVQMGNPAKSALMITREALYHISAGLKFLEDIKRVEFKYDSTKKLDEGLGDPDGDEEEAAATPAGSCIVCEHPDRVAIEQAIAEGMSLRAIEELYGVSKSSLSRHNKHMAPVSQVPDETRQEVLK